MRFMFYENSFIIKNMEDKLVISAIEPQKKKKDRYNIYADGEYVASLGAQALINADLRTGMAVDRAVLESAVFEDNSRYAFNSAAAMLAHKMRTRSELAQKLADRGISEAAVQVALDKLESYGYVDDAAYAHEFVQSAIAAGRFGRRAVAYKLAEKGLPRDVVEKAMSLYTEDDERQAASKQADALLKRYADIGKRQLQQKVYAALMRHGFDSNVLSALFSEDEY